MLNHGDLERSWLKVNQVGLMHHPAIVFLLVVFQLGFMAVCGCGPTIENAPGVAEEEVRKQGPDKNMNTTEDLMWKYAYHNAKTVKNAGWQIDASTTGARCRPGGEWGLQLKLHSMASHKGGTLTGGVSVGVLTRAGALYGSREWVVQFTPTSNHEWLLRIPNICEGIDGRKGIITQGRYQILITVSLDDGSKLEIPSMDYLVIRDVGH